MEKSVLFNKFKPCRTIHILCILLTTHWCKHHVTIYHFPVPTEEEKSIAYQTLSLQTFILLPIKRLINISASHSMQSNPPLFRTVRVKYNGSNYLPPAHTRTHAQKHAVAAVKLQGNENPHNIVGEQGPLRTRPDTPGSGLKCFVLLVNVDLLT